MFKTYYYLTKPGIIYGNLFTASAGFLLAAHGHISIGLLLCTLIGTGLVIASACVVNNVLDRNIDKKMARTRKRAIPSGTISVTNALVYAGALGFVGSFVLLAYVNILTFIVGLVGFVDYVVLYGISKRRSRFSTLVGSVSGAVPPVAGYVAVTNRLDATAALLFIIMVCWQMAHFFAIGIYRLKDYQNAHLPILPAVKGVPATKKQILLYIMSFIAAALLLGRSPYLNYFYIVIMAVVGLAWLRLSILGFRTKDDTAWAKKAFLFSLIVICVFCVSIGLSASVR